MRPVLVAWLARHGFPTWFAPDYATMVGLAGILGAFLILRQAERDRAKVWVEARALMIAYVAALLGGYVFEWIRAIPTALAMRSLSPILFAGRAAYGGLIFGLLCPALYLRWTKTPIRPFLDRATLAMGVAYGAVRFGCFLEGCDFGRPTSSWLGVRFPAGSLAADAHHAAGWIPAGAPSLPVHATELYESALGLVATALALVPLRKSKRDGTAFAVWLGTYAVGRFLLEMLRGDVERGRYAALSTAQWVSLGCLVVAFVMLRATRAVRQHKVATTTLVSLVVLGALAFPEDAHAQARPALPPSQPPPAGAPPVTGTPNQPPPEDPLGLPPQQNPNAPPAPLYGPNQPPVYWPAGERPHTEPTKPKEPEGPPPVRIVTARLTLSPSYTLARPEVPSGMAGEIDGMVRVRAGEKTRFDIGLELREFENAIARHHTLGFVAEAVFEVSRKIEITLTLVPHHTWFDFKSDYFKATNAYGLRYGAGAQLVLGSRVMLGLTPLSFNTTSGETVGVITQWEPRVWISLMF